ncbi:MAG TPA: ScbR family autoregulator-binding transcription factor [Actinomycetaceae bacterium]|nr:ScbR family autoregulator-binding transcription factor [Actinomycetaceae bacterium]
MAQQQRATETKESLIHAAAAVFGRQGYRATTLRDITREASVTQGALYFHFDSKRELAEEIIRRQHELSSAAGAAYLESTQSGIESIVRLSGDLAAQILSEPVVRAGLRLSTESAEDLAGVAAAPYRDWIHACRVLLERASVAGETRDGLNMDAAAELVISAFTGTQFVSAALSGSDDLLDRLERMWPVLLAGIVRDSHHPVLSSTSYLIRQLAGSSSPA